MGRKAKCFLAAKIHDELVVDIWMSFAIDCNGDFFAPCIKLQEVFTEKER